MLPANLLRLSRQLNLTSAKCATIGAIRNGSTAVPAKDLVLVDVNDKTGFATVSMNSLPVNSLSLPLLTALSSTLDQLNKDNPRGMILTSAAKTVFSAGIDINEMYKPDPKRVREFWLTIQDVWIKLYGSSYPTAAAINGHSPAGGCLLAMSCEYRVMLPKYTIGLNETKLGIVAPFWFVSTMRNTISAREAEMALTLGTLFKTDDALRIGMIDEIANDKAEAIAKCEAYLQRYQKVSPEARRLTKMAHRGADIERLMSSREQDYEVFRNFITGDKIQRDLGLFVKVLQARRVLKMLMKPFTPILKLFGGKTKKNKSKN